jgi:hypothetical protein
MAFIDEVHLDQYFADAFRPWTAGSLKIQGGPYVFVGDQASGNKDLAGLELAALALYQLVKMLPADPVHVDQDVNEIAATI